MTQQPQLATSTYLPLVEATDSFNAQLHKRAFTQDLSPEKLTELYLESLTPKEYKSYIIARDHLGMSFTLEKSVGFLQWMQQRKDNAKK